MRLPRNPDLLVAGLAVGLSIPTLVPGVVPAPSRGPAVADALGRPAATGCSRVIPSGWIETSTRAHSQFGDGRGYGYMWWTYRAGSLDETSYPTLSRTDLFMAREYEMASGARIRVFRFRGKPYIHVPGEGDALLFATGTDRFTIRVVPGVTVEFERDEGDEVEAVRLELGPRTIRAPKRE